MNLQLKEIKIVRTENNLDYDCKNKTVEVVYENNFGGIICEI